MSLDATLAAIDELAVQQCGHCNEPLADDGQSPDFCGPDCQQAWTETRNEIVELIGYREPYDLPVHQSRLVEFQSPEVVPTHPDTYAGVDAGAVMAGFTRGMAEAMSTLGGHFEQFASGFAEVARRIVFVDQQVGRLRRIDRVDQQVVVFQWPTDLPVSVHTATPAWDAHLARLRNLIDAAFDIPPTLIPPTLLGGGMWVSLGDTPPNTPPAEPVRDGHFDPDHEYEWRPVPYLSDDVPALPVMPAAECDWQALVDLGVQRSFAAVAPEVHQRRRPDGRSW